MHHPVLIAGRGCIEGDCLFVCDRCGADFGRHQARELAHVCPKQFADAPPFVPYAPPHPEGTRSASAPAEPRSPTGGEVVTPCGPGCQLTRLLKDIGIESTEGCGCADRAAALDHGIISTEELLEAMRREAEQRSLKFSEPQVRWLIELAHKLADERREPTRRERVRLRAIRIANRLVNARIASV